MKLHPFRTPHTAAAYLAQPVIEGPCVAHQSPQCKDCKALVRLADAGAGKVHLIHAVDADMRQEHPQIGVRQNVILRDPRHHLQHKQHLLQLHATFTLTDSAPCCKPGGSQDCGCCGLAAPVQALAEGVACPHVGAQVEGGDGGLIRHLLGRQPPQHLARERRKGCRHARQLVHSCSRRRATGVWSGQVSNSWCGMLCAWPWVAAAGRNGCKC